MGNLSTKSERLFAAVLARFESDLAGSAASSQVSIVPLEYENRPFSHILRVRVSTENGDRCYFVKIYKSKPDAADTERIRGRVSNDFATTSRIAEAMCGQGRFGVVRPVACYPDHLALVTEEAAGQTLREYLERKACWFPSQTSARALVDTLAGIGAWLRAFQAIDAPDGQLTEAELRDYVDVRLKRLVQHGAYKEAERRAVLDHLAALATGIASETLRRVLIHADLAPGNILVAGERVTVLDLAMVQRGASLHDISRLFLQLDVLRAKPQFRPATVADLQRALLEGYDATLTADRPLFRYLLMLHRINHLSTLTLNREPFPASFVSRRVLRVHRHWIANELRPTAAFGNSC